MEYRPTTAQWLGQSRAVRMRRMKRCFAAMPRRHATAPGHRWPMAHISKINAESGQPLPQPPEFFH